MTRTKPGHRPEAERLRRKALARWENEGGADPCGPQVPGVAKDCPDGEAEAGGAGETGDG